MKTDATHYFNLGWTGWNNWSAWSSCSSTACSHGNTQQTGVNKRKRQCRGGTCQGNEEETKSCRPTSCKCSLFNG